MLTPVAISSLSDLFYVRWRLNNVCNYSCSGCAVSNNGGDCVFVRDRIMRIATKILEDPHPAYEINITGGEPTLHPFVKDIVQYFLLSRKNVLLTLETNGSQEVGYYLDLIKGIAKNSFILSVGVHPGYADVGRLLALAGSIGDAGQRVHFRFADVEDSVCATLLTCMPKLQKVVPVSYDVTGSSARNVPISFLPDRTDSPTSRAYLKQNDVPVYCCHGFNVLCIEPDGHFYGASCSLSHNDLPLWAAEAEVKGAVKVIYCDLKECPGGINNLLPKYTTCAEAEDALSRLNSERLRWRYEAQPLNEGRRPDTEDLMRARLKRIAPLPAGSDISVQSIWPRWDDAVTVYSSIRDEASKICFLTCLKVFEDGNSMHIADLSQTQPIEITPSWLRDMPFCLYRDTPLDLGDLQHFTWSIKTKLPQIHLPLPLEFNSFMDQIKWLVSHLQGYEFTLTVKNSQPIFVASHSNMRRPHPNAREILHNEYQSEVLASFVLVCGNDQDSIEGTLDSVLMQDMTCMEVIVVENGVADATKDILDRTESWAGGVIRRIVFPEARPIAEAWKKGFDAVSGKTVVFAKPGDVFTADYLVKGLKAIEGADIAVFGSAEIIEGQEWHASLEKDCSHDIESLHEWLEAWARGLRLSACLFDMAFLIRNNIQLTSAAGYGEFRFGCEAFAVSGMTVAIDSIGVSGPAAMGQGLSAWRSVLDYLHCLVSDLGFDDNSILARCENRLWQLEKDCIADDIRGAMSSNCGRAALNDNTLLTISSSRETMRLLLADCAKEYCSKWKTALLNINSDPDWRKAATNMRQPRTYAAYGNADDAIGNVPVVSVIVPNYNKRPHIEACIESILSQSFRDFELIIIDDRSTDGSWEVLQDFADFDSRIRLYRMDHNCRQGICRNIGIDKSRGEFLVFVDSDDMLMPGFLDLGCKVMQEQWAEVGLFSSQHLNANGEVQKKDILPDGVIPVAKAWKQYTEGSIWAAIWARFFRASLIKSAQIRFPEYVFHQDHPFFGACIKHAKKIITSSFIACSIVPSRDSSVRPSSYSYVRAYSSVWLLKYFNSLVTGDVTESVLLKHVRVNLEDLLFPGLNAYVAHGEDLPFDDEIYALMEGNGILAYAVLESFAKLHKKDRVSQPLSQFCLLSCSHGHSGDICTVNEVDDGHMGCEFFVNAKNTLTDAEIRHALAIMRRNHSIDMVYFPQAVEGLPICDPGIFTGKDAFLQHCDDQTGILLPGACVIRRDALSPPLLIKPKLSLDDHLIFATALLRSRFVYIALPGTVRQYEAVGEWATRDDVARLTNGIWNLAVLENCIPASKVKQLLAAIVDLTDFAGNIAEVLASVEHDGNGETERLKAGCVYTMGAATNG